MTSALRVLLLALLVPAAGCRSTDERPAPAEVRLLPPSVAGSSFVRLDWTPYQCADWDRYEVHASTTAGFEASEATRRGVIRALEHRFGKLVFSRADASTTWWFVDDLTSSTNWNFRVVVFRNDGTQIPSNDVCVRTRERSSRRQDLIDEVRLRQSPETGSWAHPTDPPFVHMHNTSYAILRLKALKAEPAYEMRFLEAYDAPDEILDYLEYARQECSRAGERYHLRASEMNVGVGKIHMIQREYRRGPLVGFSAAWKEAFYGWLYEHQDPKTGYWLANGMPCLGITYHVYGVFDWEGHPVDGYTLRHAEEMVRSTLALEKTDGSWGARSYYRNVVARDEGTHHTGYDALHIIGNLYHLCSERTQRRIRKAIHHYVDWTLRETWSPEGGLRNRPSMEPDGRGCKYGAMALRETGYFPSYRLRFPYTYTYHYDEKRIPLSPIPERLPSVRLLKAGADRVLSWEWPRGEEAINTIRVYRGDGPEVGRSFATLAGIIWFHPARRPDPFLVRQRILEFADRHVEEGVEGYISTTRRTLRDEELGRYGDVFLVQAEGARATIPERHFTRGGWLIVVGVNDMGDEGPPSDALRIGH